MSDLMRRLSTAYSMYFNKKYRRVGHLFQGIYKAAYVDKDPYLLHLSRYIHLNPLELALTGFNLVKAAIYPYSSYAYYLGKKRAEWIVKDLITLPVLPQTVRDGIKAEWQSDVFTVDAISEKTALLNPEQRENIETLIDYMLKGETIKVEQL